MLHGVRDFLVLATGMLVMILPLAGWGAYADFVSWGAAFAAAGVGAAVLALLGLFMTLGGEGSHVVNAARSLAVLIAFSAGLVALLVWGASTAGGGR